MARNPPRNKPANGGTVKCRVCQQSFASRRAYNQHYESVHSSRRASPPRSLRRRRPRRLQRGPLRNTNPNAPILAPPTTSTAPNMMIHQNIAKEVRLASTAAGQAWARRALHPCDDTLGGAAPIPDPSSSASATVENRIVKVLSAPTGVTGNWDCQFVMPSTADMVCAYRTRPVGGTWSFWQALDTEAGNFRPGLFRLGNATGGSWEPAPNRAPDLVVNSNQFRGTHRGVTIFLDASAVYNQGTVTAAQFGGKPTTEPRRPIQTNYAGTNLKEIDHVLFNDIPETSSELVTKIAQAGQWPAVEGVYMPVYCQEAEHLYNGGNEQLWNVGEADATVECGNLIILKPSLSGDTFGYEKSLIYKDITATGTNNLAVSSAGATNHNVGIVFFEGIDAKANLRVKTRSGIELVPAEDNPLSAATQEPPLEDEAAIKMVHNVALKLPMAYRHEYNSMNLLLPLIREAASLVAPIFGRWFTSKTKIPLS